MNSTSEDSHHLENLINEYSKRFADEILNGVIADISMDGSKSYILLNTEKAIGEYELDIYSKKLVDEVFHSVFMMFNKKAVKSEHNSKPCNTTPCENDELIRSSILSSGFGFLDIADDLHEHVDDMHVAESNYEFYLDSFSTSLVDNAILKAKESLYEERRILIFQTHDKHKANIPGTCVYDSVENSSQKVTSQVQAQQKHEYVCDWRPSSKPLRKSFDDETNAHQNRFGEMDSSDGALIKQTSNISDIDLCDTFIAAMFERQAKLESKQRAKAKLWQNNKRFNKKTRKERKVQKKMKGLILDEPRPSYEEMEFWTDANLSLDHSLLCPICMELLYLPTGCVPCEHVFCEYCLRRLAKYLTARRMPHVCPVCRTNILTCQPNHDIEAELKINHAFVYEERQRTERQNKYKSNPLPSKQSSVSKQDIISAAMNRQRQNNYGRNLLAPFLKIFTYICISFTCLGILFVLLKRFRQEHWLLEWYLEFCNNLYEYGSLSAEMQLIVTNQAFIMLFVVGILSVIANLILN